jgi:hypothetical protein
MQWSDLPKGVQIVAEEGLLQVSQIGAEIAGSGVRIIGEYHIVEDVDPAQCTLTQTVQKNYNPICNRIVEIPFRV